LCRETGLRSTGPVGLYERFQSSSDANIHDSSGLRVDPDYVVPIAYDGDDAYTTPALRGALSPQTPLTDYLCMGNITHTKYKE